MSTKRIFLLDANVFIEAARRHYAFDIAPSFWDGLLHHATKGSIISIDRVKHELDRGTSDDPLAQWADKSFHQWFKKSDNQNVVAIYAQLMTWSQSHNLFTPAAKAEWAKGTIADAWLVAFAKINGCVLATHEGYDAKRKNKITIPAACKHLSVETTNTFEMMRELGIRL